MSQISLGKYNRLLKCSSIERTFSILAIDHRSSLRKALVEQNESAAGDSALINFKKDVVSQVGDEADAILIDPEYGLPHCVATGLLGANGKLIISIEKSGYTGNSDHRNSELLGGWNVHKSERIGAEAVKLLVYYHPESKNSAEIENLVRQVSNICIELELPFFLEPLTYSLDPNEKKLAGAEKRSIVVETARRLSVLGPDVMKMEFPVDIRSSDDKGIWKEACAELSSACQSPWVLLSAAVNYEQFIDQVRIACEQGASGIAVGRAVWKEAVSMSGAERETFLSTIGKIRMRELNALCRDMAKPWTELFQPPHIGDNWYAQY